MGAYGIAVAAAFAVALAVLVSVSSTPTAEAATVTFASGETTTDAQPGDTVLVPGGDGNTIVRFAIDAGSTSTGSFADNGGQMLSCSDSTTTTTGCDSDDAAGIVVKLNIDADSADGYIVVNRTPIVPTTAAASKLVITVTTQPKPASLSAKAIATTIDANGALTAGGAGTTQIVATVKNDQSPSAGMNGERLTFITTLGVMDCATTTHTDGTTVIPAAENVQWCQAFTTTTSETGGTAAAGNAVVTLKASGREGTATVTITHGTLDPTTVDVKLFGTAKNLNAEAEQGSVEVGGSVFVVLTVTDAAGNPVKNVQPQPAAKDPIVGPTKTANKVTTSTADDDGDAATSPYNVNKDPKITAGTAGAVSKDKGDIPSCGAFAAVAHEPDASTPVTGRFESTGTDDNGQCVVQVNATADVAATTANEASARGVHTLNFELAKLKASVEITVAGKAATIESDAPEYVEPLSDTTITVTVRDDEGVLVGATPINVIKVAGDGLAEGKATETGTMTVNGSSTFSYAAGLEGQVVFRVIAGTGNAAIRDIITLTVGEPAPDEPDEPETMPSGDATLTVDGNLGSFSGGSLAEFAAAAAEACPGGAVIWAQDSGSWLVWSSSAPDLVNLGFTTAFADGFAGTKLLWVQTCEPDAMEDEG